MRLELATSCVTGKKHSLCKPLPLNRVSQNPALRDRKRLCLDVRDWLHGHYKSHYSPARDSKGDRPLGPASSSFSNCCKSGVAVSCCARANGPKKSVRMARTSTFMLAVPPYDQGRLPQRRVSVFCDDVLSAQKRNVY